MSNRDSKLFLVQLQPNGLSKLPLLLVEAVQVLGTKFERCRHVQYIRCSGVQLGSGLTRQLARSFKDRLR